MCERTPARLQKFADGVSQCNNKGLLPSSCYQVHSRFRNINCSLMSLLLYIPTPTDPREWMNLISHRHVALPYITGFAIMLTHKKKNAKPHGSHASQCQDDCNRCHYCDIDSVLFHNVTCYTDSVSSCIHVNTTELFNITCILVDTSVILWMLECTLNLEPTWD